MSNDLISYFKAQNDNPYDLTVGEASSHMLALHKFMEGYLDKFVNSLDEKSNQNLIEYEKRKILDFLFMMTNILAESNINNYFYDTTLVSKNQLEDLEKEIIKGGYTTKEVLHIAMEELSITIGKISEKFRNL